MARMGFSSAPGVKKHSQLSDVSTPHVLADLEGAVCSETEAAAISIIGGIRVASPASLALFIEEEVLAADAATMFEDTDITPAKAASIFDHANLTAQLAADIFDHANLSAARAGAIAVHPNLTQARYDAIVALMVDPSKLAGDATLAMFQLFPATGTVTTPDNVNDDNPGSVANGDVIGEYAEVDFKRWVKIDQWRIYGNATNNENGEWKIEYHGDDLAWHDWVTGIPTNLGVWTAMAPETEAVCSKIRLTCVVVDTGAADSVCGQLEVYHS